MIVAAHAMDAGAGGRLVSIDGEHSTTEAITRAYLQRTVDEDGGEIDDNDLGKTISFTVSGPFKIGTRVHSAPPFIRVDVVLHWIAKDLLIRGIVGGLKLVQGGVLVPGQMPIGDVVSSPYQYFSIVWYPPAGHVLGDPCRPCYGSPPVGDRHLEPQAMRVWLAGPCDLPLRTVIVTADRTVQQLANNWQLRIGDQYEQYQVEMVHADEGTSEGIIGGDNLVADFKPFSEDHYFVLSAIRD